MVGWLTKDAIEAARDTHDRRRTPALLAMLRDPTLPDALRAAAVEALERTDDGRAYEPLLAIVEDGRVYEAPRAEAGNLLAEMLCAPAIGSRDVERWWQSDDAALRRIAVRHMTRAQEPIVLALLDDPAHALHAEAVGTLRNGFDHPRFVTRALTALSHADPKVRRAAVDAVLFTEPLAAIAPLLALLDDPDPDVANGALYALDWYDSREVLLGVAAFRDRTSDAGMRERADDLVASIAWQFAATLRRSPAGDARLRAWLEPVWPWVEAATRTATESPPAESLPRATKTAFDWCTSPAAFRAHFSVLDQPWDDLESELCFCDWSGVPSETRAALGDLLLTWPDATVRYYAVRAFEAWRDEPRMLALLDDVSSGVAASACHHLGTLGRSDRAAPALRERLERLRWGARANEAFRSYATVAASADWHALAAGILADPDADESLRVAVAYALSDPAAVEVVRAHVDLLTAAPRIRWSFHAALLDAARAHALAVPDLTHLREAGDLALQEALVRYESARAARA